MECMCAQTRPRFILSSKRVLGGMQSEPMLTPRKKISLAEKKCPKRGIEPTTLHLARQRAPHTTKEVFRPPPLSLPSLSSSSPLQKDFSRSFCDDQTRRRRQAINCPGRLPPPFPWTLISPVSWATDREFLFVGCLTSQQHTTVSQGRICPGKSAFCHAEIEVADETRNLTQSQYTDTGPTSPCADPVQPPEYQCLLVAFKVPATCWDISGTNLLRQVYAPPHCDRSCRSNFLPHPVTVY